MAGTDLVLRPWGLRQLHPTLVHRKEKQAKNNERNHV